MDAGSLADVAPGFKHVLYLTESGEPTLSYTHEPTLSNTHEPTFSNTRDNRHSAALVNRHQRRHPVLRPLLTPNVGCIALLLMSVAGSVFSSGCNTYGQLGHTGAGYEHIARPITAFAAK